MEIETEVQKQTTPPSVLSMNEECSPLPVLPSILAEDEDIEGKESGDETVSSLEKNTPIKFSSIDPVESKKEAIKKSPNTIVKRPRHNPSERRILLAKAVEDVKTQRISMRRAAQRYNLAKSSLCDYVRKQGIILPTVRYKNNSNAQNNPNNINVPSNNLSSIDNKLPTQVPSITNNLMAHLSPLNTTLFNNQSAYKKMKLDEFNLKDMQAPPQAILSPFQLITSNRNLNHLLLTNQNLPPFNTSANSNNNSNNILSSMLVNLLNNQSMVNNVQNNTDAGATCLNSNPLRTSFPSLTTFPGQNYASDVNNLLLNFQQRMSKEKIETRCSSPDINKKMESDLVSANSLSPKTPVKESTDSSQCHTPKSTDNETKQNKSQFNNSCNGQIKIAPIFGQGKQLTHENFDEKQCDFNFFPGPLLLNNTNVSSTNSLLNPLVDTQATLAALLSSNSAYQPGQQHVIQNNHSDRIINSNNSDDQIQTPDNADNSKNIFLQNHNFQIPYPHGLNNNSNNNSNDSKSLYNLNIFESTNHQFSNIMTSVANIQQLQKAKELVQFINNSPTPFHVVRTVKDRLTGSGFRELKDTDPSWNLKPNDKVFLSKNGSTIFAIAVGALYKPDSGFSIFGAHTDSPCLRVKPNSTRISQETVQLGVETYGGGLWYTWLDRDLTLAGRCIIKKEGNSIVQKLVNLEKPVACVPSLAIHLNRDQNKSFAPSLENHLVPIICSEVNAQLNQGNSSDFENRHPIELVNALASKLDCQPKEIIESELYLVDTQPATIGGINNEFIHAPRLDNQFNCFVGTEGFLNALQNLEHDENVRILCLYDHEEVGSTSCQGANSSYTANLLKRIHENLNGGKFDHNNFGASMGKSLLISADQAHAIHPSHPEKHERNHQPRLHSNAVVIKNNVNQRYTTNSLTSAILRSLASKENVEIINFVINQDMSCGSTIGPMLSSQLGVQSIDTGSAQVAMHSCRELAGVASIKPAIDLYKSFFCNLSDVMKSLRCEM